MGGGGIGHGVGVVLVCAWGGWAGQACWPCLRASGLHWRRSAWSGRGGEGPGTVLSQAVDVGKGLSPKEGDKTALGVNLLDDLHGNQVLISLDGVDPVLQGHLQLAVGFTLGQGVTVELELESGPVKLVARFWSREKDPFLVLLKATPIKTLHLIYTFK